ncbi:hypothetical protein HN011_002285 [Eciton burchellii]|nr:hypothetical protein HN011_002285 [Eciton burchellii]
MTTTVNAILLMIVIERLQREIRTIDLNVLSDDLTDEERSVRSILKSRRRLRMEDADKVAQYFINGGPSAGYSHFIRPYNVAYDSADSTSSSSFSGTSSKRNPENEFYDVSSHILLRNSISWIHIILHSISEAARQEDPVMSDTRERSLILGTVNSILNQPNEYDLISSLLGTVAHPYREYDNKSPLHNTLLRTATLPTQFLHNLFAYRSSNPAYQGIVTSANPLQDDLLNIPFADKWKNAGETITSYDSSNTRNNII